MTDFILREWQMSDAASIAENANNIHIWNNLRDGLPHPYSEKDGKEYIEMALSKPKPATLFAIAVEEKAVGSIGIFPRTDVERITAELGYFIGEKYWNQGIMTAAVKEMVNYAFTHFPLQKIFATPFDFNIASQKVLQKAGFEQEAILKQAAIKNGKIIDLHYYSLLKNQWQSDAKSRSDDTLLTVDFNLRIGDAACHVSTKSRSDDTNEHDYVMVLKK